MWQPTEQHRGGFEACEDDITCGSELKTQMGRRATIKAAAVGPLHAQAGQGGATWQHGMDHIVPSAIHIFMCKP